ncbi:MAG: restriction endonuclease [Anaerolineae bacterium]
MSLWLVRAGAHGEQETLALEKNMVVIGWEELGDLSQVANRDDLLELLRKTYPQSKEKTILNFAGQLWAFVREIQVNDLVALPLKGRPAIVFGRITGPYQYRLDMPARARHTRPVEWLKEIPRTAIDQDLLYSFGAFMTVCRIQRNNAEERIRALLEGHPPRVPPVSKPTEGEGTDLEELALDGIRKFISQRFKGHRLTDLVAAILTAQGYKVQVSPAGPDGGIDILAGSGELGFDQPRIAVQVKSGDDPADIKVVRELQGGMKNFQAQQGLFVSWAGFKPSVKKEEARLFFEIRLWSSEDLIREIFRLYEKLPEEIQAELPLKRIWVLVPASEE